MEIFGTLMYLDLLQIGPGVKRQAPWTRRARKSTFAQDLLDLSSELSLLGMG
jgi:hypothetical protein